MCIGGELELQEYLKLSTKTREAAQTLFRYRVIMANYGEYFRRGNGPVNCPLCGSHLDGQKMGFENCPFIKSKVQIAGNYKDIVSSQVKSDMVCAKSHKRISGRASLSSRCELSED